ncbi:MAG: OprO/OprP family phosphate-selective porin, partial [Candidatus Binataceae bacterium]
MSDLPKKPAVTVKASSKGFFLESQDGEFKLRVGGYIQEDSRWYTTGDKPTTGSTFVMRRVRLIVDGDVFKQFSFRMSPDFGEGQVRLFDAYIDYHPMAEFSVRAGKYKEPVGLERLRSAQHLTFVERALPDNLVPNRDTGVDIHGELFEGSLNYALGVYNGVRDHSTDDFASGSPKEFAARFFGYPFKQTTIEELEGLGLGVAGTIGDQRGALATYNTAGRTTFFAYSKGVSASGLRWRVSPQVYYSYRSFGLLTEFVQNVTSVTKAPAKGMPQPIFGDIRNIGWQAAGSYLLTGEKAMYGAVKVLNPFDPFGAGGYGAWEIGARYSQLLVDGDAFRRGFASLSSSSRRAKE